MDVAIRPKDNVLCWREVEGCSRAVQDVLETLISDDVVEEFKRNPPPHVMSDDLTWLDEIVARVTAKEYVDTKSDLTERLRKKYSALRAFHACCPANVESYYGQGLLPFNPERFNGIARQIFLAGEYPEITDTMLDEAIRTVGTDLRRDCVYFGIDDKFLVEHCGHYLLYGSEYLVSIAAALSRGATRDYRAILKGRGTPTVLVCNVPLDLVPEWAIADLGGILLEDFFQRVLDPTHRRGLLDFGFDIEKPVPPHVVVEHYHPTTISDPLIQSAIPEP